MKASKDVGNKYDNMFFSFFGGNAQFVYGGIKSLFHQNLIYFLESLLCVIIAGASGARKVEENDFCTSTSLVLLQFNQ